MDNLDHPARRRRLGWGSRSATVASSRSGERRERLQRRLGQRHSLLSPTRSWSSRQRSGWVITGGGTSSRSFGVGTPKHSREANRRDTPILLSIGYAACHWCHVMAHESGAPVPLFTGRDVIDGHAAAYVCRGFVCERPVTHPDQLRL
ncbi:MAG: DUF255 domain-containing protein [Nocardioidaceae bacterium]